MEAIKNFINACAVPSRMFPVIVLLFFFVFPVNSFFEKYNKLFFLDRLWTKKGGIFLFSTLTMFLSIGMLDENFRHTVSKPDNLPIVGLIYASLFFLWVALSQARENDLRLEKNEKPKEWHDSQEKILVWPDLVSIELIAMLFALGFLFTWGILVDAPLEEPANLATSPNPAKAPWYFLALQEMLVYFDPALAGVIFPTLIVVGLMAIPYIDNNHKATGYYTFKERKLAITIFLFGWIILWLFMMVIGTILRGPNWNFYGPFEYWDPHKVEALTNINLSEYLYVIGLNMGLPGNIFIREAPGIFLISLYFIGGGFLLTKTVFKNLFKSLGPLRYSFFLVLLLFATSLPIKMTLRWLFNLKYIVSIPEFFFNI